MIQTCTWQVYLTFNRHSNDIECVPSQYRCPCADAGAGLSCEWRGTSCTGCDPGKDCKVWDHVVSFRGIASGGSRLRWHAWRKQDSEAKTNYPLLENTVGHMLVDYCWVCVFIVALTDVSPERCQRKQPCWLAWADSADDDYESEEESYWPGREKNQDVGELSILGWKIKANGEIKQQSICVCRQSVTFTRVKWHIQVNNIFYKL